MLARMIKIDDLNRAGEVPIGDIPDPLRSVPDHHLLLGPAPATFPDFGVDAGAEPLGRFNSANIRLVCPTTPSPSEKWPHGEKTSRGSSARRRKSAAHQNC